MMQFILLLFYIVERFTTSLNNRHYTLLSSWIVRSNSKEFSPSFPQRITENVLQVEGGTKTGVKNLVKKKLILINNQPANVTDTVKDGDEVRIIAKGFSSTPSSNVPLSIPLKVLYEDDYCAVVIKPPGMAIYQSSESFPSLSTVLLSVLDHPCKVDPSRNLLPIHRPKPAHRIDKDTNGLVLVAKCILAQQNLPQQFAERKIKKCYHAIVGGVLSTKEGVISFPLDNREAITEYLSLDTLETQEFGLVSLLRLSPLTGRNHQIRRHLKAIGFPILGDRIYGGRLSNQASPSLSLQLFATGIEFYHPYAGEKVSVVYPNPPYAFCFQTKHLH